MPPPLDQVSPGAVIGACTVVRVLGRGGMGIVYEAHEDPPGRLVALKVPGHDQVQQPSLRARFEREARAAAAVSHPNVVTIHAVAEVDGWPYLVLELVPGGSLRELLRARGGRLPGGRPARSCARSRSGWARSMPAAWSTAT